MHVKTITHAVAFGHGDRLGGHIYGCPFCPARMEANA
jgi:hypothetical protein